MNVSSTTPPFSGEGNTTEYDDMGYFEYSQGYRWSILSLTALFCLCGLAGNGMVIWLLGFCIKRNPFTTYILNLAIADFGTLLSLSADIILNLIEIHGTLLDVASFIRYPCIFFTYSASVYFLTAISLERCLSVLFPIWYRCHRPKRSSAVVSFLLWSISGLLSGMLLVFDAYLLNGKYLHVLLKTIFIVNLLVFTPIMVASTLIMSIKLCHGTQRRQPPRLYVTILVTLLFFIIFAIPLSAMHFAKLNDGPVSLLQYKCSFLFASINSSINPIIYYFVGRNRKKTRESLKVVMKRAFRDEAVCQGGT